MTAAAKGSAAPARLVTAALTRFETLTDLDEDAVARLVEAAEDAQAARPRSELIVEGCPIPAPRIILSGWSARMRILSDGRRQFLGFLLPGDLVGLCRQAEPVATSTVVTLTTVSTCPAPPAEPGSALEQAYAVSGAFDEAHLLAQIVRLGRMNAQERIVDLFLELLDRLTLNGMAQGRSFAFPVTQEMLADTLGLTPVHINRMLQIARRQGDLLWTSGRVTVPDSAALARQVGRVPVRVTTA